MHYPPIQNYGIFKLSSLSLFQLIILNTFISLTRPVFPTHNIWKWVHILDLFHCVFSYLFRLSSLRSPQHFAAYVFPSLQESHTHVGQDLTLWFYTFPCLGLRKPAGKWILNWTVEGTMTDKVCKVKYDS